MVGDELLLRQYAGGTFRNVDIVRGEERQTYYRVMAERLHEAHFRNDTERIVLTLVTEGVKIKKIVEALEVAGHARCRFTVRCIIRKYEIAWGLRAPQKKCRTA